MAWDDLTEEDRQEMARLLRQTIDGDRYPLSPRTGFARRIAMRANETGKPVNDHRGDKRGVVDRRGIEARKWAVFSRADGSVARNCRYRMATALLR
jgi:hypothetical protein